MTHLSAYASELFNDQDKQFLHNSRTFLFKWTICSGIFSIEENYGDETYRNVKESFWIKKLKTLSPYGVNRQIDLQ